MAAKHGHLQVLQWLRENNVLGMRKRMPLLHSRPLGGTTMGAREWMPCNADKGLSVAKCRGHFNVVQWIRESLAGE